MNFWRNYPAHSLRDALFVVVPVPYDLTSTYHLGAAGDRQQSSNFDQYGALPMKS